jgi:hypothetical protein
MEETKEVPVQYRVPSDIEAFLQILPPILGSLAAKNTEPRMALDLSIALTREALAAMVSLGVCNMTTRCTDGLPLATPQGSQVAAPEMPETGNGSGRSKQGAMVSMFPTTQIRTVQGL